MFEQTFGFMVALGRGGRRLEWSRPETTGIRGLENKKETEWNKMMRLNVKIMMEDEEMGNENKQK